MTLSWSIGTILVKKSFAKLTPWQTYAFDAVFVALPLWLIYGYLNNGHLINTTPLAFTSAFIISIVYAIYYYAIYSGPLGLTTLIIATYPVFAVILSFLFLSERLNLFATIGIALTMAGIILISLPGKFRLKLEKWTLLSLSVSFGYGLTAYTGKLAVSQVGNATYMMILSITQVMVIVLWRIFIKDPLPKFNAKTLALPALGILLLNIGNIAYYIALESGLASIVVPLSNSYIVLLVILSVILLKEKIMLHQYLGIIIVVTGVILINFCTNQVCTSLTSRVRDILSIIPMASPSPFSTQRSTLPPERWNSSTPEENTTNNPLSFEKAKVAFVYDGDTIQLTDGRKIRYIGINTPEVGSTKKPGECFSDEAQNINKQLIAGQTIEMAKDNLEIDKYGRLLRYVWIEDVFINDFMVRQGYAKIETIPPNTKYSGELKNAEKEAKENKRGLWGKCQ